MCSGYWTRYLQFIGTLTAVNLADVEQEMLLDTQARSLISQVTNGVLIVPLIIGGKQVVIQAVRFPQSPQPRPIYSLLTLRGWCILQT